MKGISATMWIIIAAVIVIVIAIVLLSMFGTSVTPVGSFAEANSMCMQICRSTCKTTNNLPPTWSIKTMMVENQLKSCQEITGINDCGPCK